MSLPSSPAPSDPFLVGDFLVVPERNELRQLEEGTGRPSGEALRLTSKQMDVLVVLASKPGLPVGKNELFETVWPGVIVGEDNISSCIYELRKAFGDQAYIKTVRNRGYLLAPAVTRPLPARLLEALDPAVHETAENLLAGLALEPPAPPPPPTGPEPAERFDRQTRRMLATAFTGLALAVVLGVLLLMYFGAFTVALGKFTNATGGDSFNDVAKALDSAAWDYLHKNDTYYRVTRIPFLASSKVTLTMEQAGAGNLRLAAKISGGPDGLPELIEVEGAAGSRDLGSRLFQGIERVLDTRACRMESKVDMLKAGHCLSAGLRQVKNRDWSDAKLLLGQAEKFYEQLLAEDKRRDVAIKLILIYDQLANVEDIRGQRSVAEQHLDKARRLLDDPTLEFDVEGIHDLRIRRRQAQIDEDVDLELRLLQLLRTMDRGEPEWRHSLGWFEFTHKRNCNYAETQFNEAIDDANTDPSIRATYYSYRGEIQLTCRMPAAAIFSFGEHIRLNPVEADPYEMLAIAHMRIGKYGEARADFNQALALDPELSSAIIGKGYLEAELGHYQDAEREYQRALEQAKGASNERRDALIALGRLALRQGDAEKAAALAARAVQLRGGSQVLAYWLLGQASLAGGKQDAAQAALAALEGIYGASTSKYLREYLHHLRAQLLLTAGDGAAALVELDSALENYPGEPFFFLTAKAQALEALGRDEEAFTAYQAILSINEQHPLSLCAAARLAEKLKPAEAPAFYARARDILGDSSEDVVCQSCLERAKDF